MVQATHHTRLHVQHYYLYMYNVCIIPSHCVDWLSIVCCCTDWLMSLDGPKYKEKDWTKTDLRGVQIYEEEWTGWMKTQVVNRLV